MATSPKFIFEKEFLKEEIFICLSIALNSIKVPPLKSIPRFKPLIPSSNNEIKTRTAEIAVKVYKIYCFLVAI